MKLLPGIIVVLTVSTSFLYLQNNILKSSNKLLETKLTNERATIRQLRNVLNEVNQVNVANTKALEMLTKQNLNDKKNIQALKHYEQNIVSEQQQQIDQLELALKHERDNCLNSNMPNAVISLLN